VLSPVGYAAADAKLAWHVFDFDDRDSPFTVPAAANGRPAVGILALGFTAKTVGPMKTVTAVLEASAGPDERVYPYPFQVAFTPRSAFDVNPPDFAVGDLPEGAPPRTFDVYVYSTTRKPGDLNPPVASLGGNDPMVKIGKPIPMTEAETAALARRAKDESKLILRVRSGYRVPVTILRDPPGHVADIGKFEKTLHVTVPPGTHTVQTVFRGRVTGLVQLEADKKGQSDKIDFGTYNSAFTNNVTARIYTTNKDLELQLDPVLCTPPFVQYTLQPLTQTEGRKYWEVKAVIPPGVGRKPPWEGVLFLRAKGSDGKQAIVRLPVTGNGIGR
jgi:hypothetical protein